MSEVAAPPEMLPLELVSPSLPARAGAGRPIWEVMIERASHIPEEEADRIPHDGSVNLDHYLYGAPKKEQE